MFWNPCRCGHPSEKHYWSGMQRQGACKAAGCGCERFHEEGAAGQG